MLPNEGRPALHVLVVEDNAVNQMLADALLKKAGHTVETAKSGEEALTALGSRAFDFVFMDVELPVMDGFEATARIREQERSSGGHIPIVAMTAHSTQDARQRCLDAGMDGYISKPIDAKELYRALAALAPSTSVAERTARACQTAPSSRASLAKRDEAQPARVEPPPELFDRAALLARVGVREDRLRAIIQTFLDESRSLMAELRRAIIEGDASTLRRSAHSLKGAASIFGASRVVEAAAVLEDLGQASELSAAAEAYTRLDHELSKLTAALAFLLRRSPGEP
jgi:two-component system, sensor histidine kinase and response regulator